MSRSKSVLKRILAISWTNRVPTLIITNEKLANHRLVGDPNGLPKGNDERPAPLGPIGKDTNPFFFVQLRLVDIHQHIYVGLAKPPFVSPIRRKLVIRPLLQIMQTSPGSLGSSESVASTRVGGGSPLVKILYCPEDSVPLLKHRRLVRIGGASPSPDFPARVMQPL